MTLCIMGEFIISLITAGFCMIWSNEAPPNPGNSPPLKSRLGFEACVSTPGAVGAGEGVGVGVDAGTLRTRWIVFPSFIV